MEALDLGALGFWLFVAAFVVAGFWKDARLRAEKHETLRRIVEKTGTIDEAKLKELFSDAESETSPSKPGGGYRALRVAGTVVMFIGAAVMTFFLVAAGVTFLFGDFEELRNSDVWIPAAAVPAAIALVGYGLFFSSRFAEPPTISRNDPSAS